MVRNVSAGVLTALVSLVFNLSYAALIFSGPLAAGLPLGIASALVSMTCVSLVVALLSPFRNAVAGPEGNTAALLAVAAAAIAAQVVAARPGADAVPTVLWMLVLVTAATGATLYVLGAIRGGGWIRFVPYPVIGGFIMGSAWFLIGGALRVALGVPLDRAHLATLDSTALARLGAAALFALAVAAEARYVRKAVGVPLLILGIIAAFDLGLYLAHVSRADAAHAGWLVAIPSHLAIWTPWTGHDLHAVDWGVLGTTAPELATIVVVAIVSILFNATGLELETNADVDLDRELRAEGIANLVAPLGGGFLGYLSFNRTMLHVRLGGSARVGGVAIACASALVLAGGWRVIAAVPTFVLAGLLLGLGVQMFYRWLVVARRQLATPEYVAMVLILGLIVIWGFLTGLIAGVVVGALLFAYNYSRIDVV